MTTARETIGEALAEWERAMLSERKDWQARQRMLDRRPDYRRLADFAHDLRNGDPLSMDLVPFKRDYQSAVTWWLCGTLRPFEFFARTRAFEHAIAREFERRETFEAAQFYIDKDYQKYVRAWNRRGFVSRIGWTRLQEQKRRREEWLAHLERRRERARQRKLLEQGRETLWQMRRMLRHGVEQSQPPVSTPVRTSPTS